MRKTQVLDTPEITGYKNLEKLPKQLSEFEEDPFTKYQNLLYKRALFGLSIYPKDEVEIMHWDKRRRIENVKRHAQEVLNTWKQQIINTLTNELLLAHFPISGKSGLVKEIVDQGSYTDPSFICVIDFKSLGVSKQQIVDKLIASGVLPINFYEMKKDPNRIPKLRKR